MKIKLYIKLATVNLRRRKKYNQYINYNNCFNIININHFVYQTDSTTSHTNKNYLILLISKLLIVETGTRDDNKEKIYENSITIKILLKFILGLVIMAEKFRLKKSKSNQERDIP